MSKIPLRVIPVSDHPKTGLGKPFGQLIPLQDTPERPRSEE
jgi:hypothetical protein